MITFRTMQKATMIGAAALMIGTGGALADSHATAPDATFFGNWQQSLDNLRDMSPKWGKQSVHAFKEAVDAGEPMQFLDVRTTGEWEKGVIDGALLINLNELPSEATLAMLPEDRDAVLAVYCKAGHRSTLALNMLHQLGYKNAITVAGGMMAWTAAGYPTVDMPK